MPCFRKAAAVTVDKSYCGGKLVVVVNQIREIRHGLFAFVCRCTKRGGRIVNNIDRALPSAEALDTRMN